MDKLRKSLFGLAVSAGVVLSVVLSAAPAQAAGYGYDGTDPASTGCATGSTAIASFPIKVNGTGSTVATLEVRYSSACGTNWVRINNTVSGMFVNKWIQRTSSPVYTQEDTDTNVGWSYGMQVYAPGSTCIQVDGVLIYNDGNNDPYAWSGWHSLC